MRTKNRWCTTLYPLINATFIVTLWIYASLLMVFVRCCFKGRMTIIAVKIPNYSVEKGEPTKNSGLVFIIIWLFHIKFCFNLVNSIKYWWRKTGCQNDGKNNSRGSEYNAEVIQKTPGMWCTLHHNSCPTLSIFSIQSSNSKLSKVGSML